MVLEHVDDMTWPAVSLNANRRTMHSSTAADFATGPAFFQTSSETVVGGPEPQPHELHHPLQARLVRRCRHSAGSITNPRPARTRRTSR